MLKYFLKHLKIILDSFYVPPQISINSTYMNNLFLLKQFFKNIFNQFLVPNYFSKFHLTIFYYSFYRLIYTFQKALSLQNLIKQVITFKNAIKMQLMGKYYIPLKKKNFKNCSNKDFSRILHKYFREKIFIYKKLNSTLRPSKSVLKSNFDLYLKNKVLIKKS